MNAWTSIGGAQSGNAPTVTTIYVSTSGNDNNPGTQDAPVATLDRALSLRPAEILLTSGQNFTWSIPALDHVVIKSTASTPALISVVAPLGHRFFARTVLQNLDITNDTGADLDLSAVSVINCQINTRQYAFVLYDATIAGVVFTTTGANNVKCLGNVVDSGSCEYNGATVRAVNNDAGLYARATAQTGSSVRGVTQPTMARGIYAAGNHSVEPIGYNAENWAEWPESLEIRFANGTYGQRRTGTIALEQNIPNEIVILPVGTVGTLISIHGGWQTGTGGFADSWWPPAGEVAVSGLIAAHAQYRQTNGGAVLFRSQSDHDRTLSCNAYNFAFLYVK